MSKLSPSITQRNFKIVRYVKKGIRCVDVANIVGLTRERIRQIYKEMDGRNPSERKVPKEIMYRKRLFCNFCGKRFFAGSRLRFCSKKCWVEFNVRSNSFKKINTCRLCGVKYYPLRNKETPSMSSKFNFCSRKHNIIYQNYIRSLKISNE